MHADAKHGSPCETARPIPQAPACQPVAPGPLAPGSQPVDTQPVVTVGELALAARHRRAVDERSRRVGEKLRRELGEEVSEALDDHRVIEIMLNPDGRLWVERLGEPMKPCGTMSASQAESLLATVAASLRTTLTRDAPILECELPLEGSRFEALLPPVTAAPTFTIRKKASRIFTLDNFVTQGVMTSTERAALGRAVAERRSVLVVGATGSGKTTFANGIVHEMTLSHPGHRVVVIEDTPEIQCSAPNNVLLRTTATVDMLRLLKATMRLRPDRIVVGEVRGAEALALLKAWNTGHPGGCATVHANSAEAGLWRLEQLASEANAGRAERLIAEAIDVVIFVEKRAEKRCVSEMMAVLDYDAATQRYVLEPAA